MSNTSITDLLANILTVILNKLSIKGIVMCKSVCKKWYNLISNPSFAEKHFSLAQPYPLVRAIGYELVSRILYLVEFPEMGTGCVYDWETRCVNDSEGNQKILKFESKLMVPLRNAESILNTEFGAVYGVHVKRTLLPRVKETSDHYYELVNSCDGFICLSERTSNNPAVVCNPVTGEFVDLTDVSTADMNTFRKVYCGFGFDTERTEYKVIRILMPKLEPTNLEHGWICSVLNGKMTCANVAEVLTLGLGSWKNIGYAPFGCYRMFYPTYLNGSLHWILHFKGRFYLLCFDFDKEKFHYIPLPQELRERISFKYGKKISLGVLGGCLSVCDSFSMKSLHIWVMREAGAVRSWTQDFSIDISSDGLPHFPCCVYQPLGLLTNGSILLFHEDEGALISYHPEKQWLRKYMEIQVKAEFQAIVLIPSFKSLKEALKGNEVQVHNIGSRCGEYKLVEEVIDDHFLVEDERYFTSQDPHNHPTGDPPLL